jgi:6,7-dimethyl-8-ribityllumazine synthase
MRTDAARATTLPSAAGMRFAIVVSRFNDDVTSALRRGAADALTEAGAAAGSVEIFEVPGAFELPLAARWTAAAGRFDAVICLGCVIRGETPHFEYISSAVAHGLVEIGMTSGVPMAFGVLTTNTVEQAEERSAPGGGNKGREAAIAALEMAHLRRRIASRPPVPGGIEI